MTNEKSYDIEYIITIEHDTNALDIMDLVNKTLRNSGSGYKFIIEDKHNSPDNTYLNYSLWINHE